MSDDALAALARRAGVSPIWRDVFGKEHQVSPQTLRAVLAAINLPAESETDIADSNRQLSEQEGGSSLPPLVTALSGEAVILPANPARYKITLEDGASEDGIATDDGRGRACVPAVQVPGYHVLELGDATATLAVAPRRCFSIDDFAPGTRLWGLALQLYSARRAGDGGLGDFGGLRNFLRAAARHGADAVAISPVHAQFSADPDRFSPYAPSSRSLLNVVHAEPPNGFSGDETARLERLPLVDWPAATRARLGAFRRAFEQVATDDPALAAFRREQGDVLETHAAFEALHEHFFRADPAKWHWRTWPEEYRDPHGPAIKRFVQDHAREVAFHAWLQFRADKGLGSAQSAAREAGMRIGLISDLAVGTDSGGSHSWSRPDEMLIGMTVGAPPDLLSPQGQNWGLVGFSPRGLLNSGYSAFLEMIRAALRHAGGVRIDHAMGLTRLWVLPEGAGAQEGAYLRFPEQDLLRLVALESSRHRAIVLGEDLGTVPEGFQDRLRAAGVMGMRVLWFERDEGWFTRPSAWTPEAVAMTSTHDLPTVAGWWSGTDLERRGALGFIPDEEKERRERDRDRGALWDAFLDSGAAEGEAPSPDHPEPAVDAAIRHAGRAACQFVLLPTEDALAQREQPNLPGTLHEHPNWQRRLPGAADEMFNDPAVGARLAGLAEARKRA